MGGRNEYFLDKLLWVPLSYAWWYFNIKPFRKSNVLKDAKDNFGMHLVLNEATRIPKILAQ